jgi:hypothetical protein
MNDEKYYTEISVRFSALELLFLNYAMHAAEQKNPKKYLESILNIHVEYPEKIKKTLSFSLEEMQKIARENNTTLWLIDQNSPELKGLRPHVKKIKIATARLNALKKLADEDKTSVNLFVKKIIISVIKKTVFLYKKNFISWK